MLCTFSSRPRLFIHLVSYIRNLYSSTIACWSMTAFIYTTKLHVHFFIYESYLFIVLVPPGPDYNGL